jgi:TRAP-type mannitol/chloroaromatic compound transport system substrate-binding protein
VHYDEYEISLTRELNVCKNTIQRIQKSLGILERKHNMTTEAFIQELQNNKLTDHPEFKEVYDAWQSSYESLKRWEELEQKYREEFRRMKI